MLRFRHQYALLASCIVCFSTLQGVEVRGRFVLPVVADSSNHSSDVECRVSYDPRHDPCSDVVGLCSNITCPFVQEASSCTSQGGKIPYFNFIYCAVPENLIPLVMIILFIWLVMLFIFLGTIADEYFTPSLIVMSQLLRMNQNLAGVTLLALGNGAPDIFSAFSAISRAENGEAGLAIGALFGAGMFVTTVVTGLVSICTPFSLTQRPFMRDIIFYIFACYMTFYVLWDNNLKLYEAILFVAIYILYVLVVILGRFIYQRFIKKKKKNRGTDIKPPTKKQDGKEMKEGSSIKPSNEDTGDGEDSGITEMNTDQNLEENPAINNDVESQSTTSDNEEPPATEKTPLLTRQVRGRPYTLLSPPSHSPPLDVIVEVKNDARRRSLSMSNLEDYPSDDNKDDEDNIFSSNIDLLRLSKSEKRGENRDDEDIPFQLKLYNQQKLARRQRRRFRKTVSGALDITEDITVAVLGNPQLSAACHHTADSTVPSEAPTPPPSRMPSSGGGGMLNLSKLMAGLKDKDKVTPSGPHPFKKMIKGIWPFNESFKNLKWYQKIIEILKTPWSIILALTVPIVDYDEDDHKWNKWLNVLHCVTAPLTLVLLFQPDPLPTPIGLILIGEVFPVWSLVVCLGTALAILVALTSRNETPPKYHGPVFAFLAFLSSIIWIYVVANEVVGLLQAIGIVLRMSDAVLGLTLLAWGNSIGDAISNLTVARQGFPRTAISACFGGPLLNMLLGIGIGAIYKSLQNPDHSFKINFHSVELVASGFLILSLCFQLIATNVIRFKLARVYGIVVICLYVLFLLVSLLTESKVIRFTIEGVLTGG